MRAPEWSPDGNWIAFTRRGPDGRRIGIMRPDGTGERMLTNGPADEGPSWAASSRELVFQRTDGDRAIGALSASRWMAAQPRKIAIPQNGSDPDWSGVMD